MADINKELDVWKNASKGEDVRDAQIELSKKLNKEIETATKTVGEYESAETGRIDAEKARVTAETKRQQDATKSLSESETATRNATDIYNRLKDIDVAELASKLEKIDERVTIVEDTAITMDIPITFDRGEEE